MSNSYKIFVIDNDRNYSDMLELRLSELPDTEVFCFKNAEEALDYFEAEPTVILVDYHLDSEFRKKLSGLDVLKQVKAANITTEVVMLTSRDELDIYTKGLKYGAYECRIKSLDNLNKIVNTVRNIYRQHNLAADSRMYRNSFNLISAMCLLLMIGSGIAYATGLSTLAGSWL